MPPGATRPVLWPSAWIGALAAAWIATALAACAGCSGDGGAASGANAPGGGGGAGASAGGDDATGPSSSSGGAAGSSSSADGGALPSCPSNTTAVTDGALVDLGAATTAEEYALTFDATSASKTSWAEAGNEAVVLDVLRGAGASPTFVGNVVLHQGQDGFTYGMHLGALAAGEPVRVRVSSTLSAPKAVRAACVGAAKLTPASAMGAAAEGMVNAPIVTWPKAKAFDDLPVLLGWSHASQGYQLVYTNENGGTCALCGGGALGVRSEIGRWGRALDMEGVWGYGAHAHFERCTGTVAPASGAPRMEAAHPVLYYGDGHNRLFESRGGYGLACGASADTAPNGPLVGWGNTQNPGNAPSMDGPYVVVLRPLPVDLDAVGVRQWSGRREAIVDTYAPWIYRLTSSELEREDKIDGTHTFAMDRYLYVDVYAAGVDGSGDGTCGPIPQAPQTSATVHGGFVLRATAKQGFTSNSTQMTADYFGGAKNVKRMAVPLAMAVPQASDVTKLVFDAYDADGIYLIAIGDAFIARPKGTNGATLDYVHKGKKDVGDYVDDASAGCVNGQNTFGGMAYACVGGQVAVPLP